MERTQATAAASLKAYVENIMRRHSIRKAGGALGKAYFARNPMRVVLPPEFDPRELPEQYQKITVEPRK
ncbi:MAG: hypothetical protein GTO41_04870, partial [Burkholderiales bacterium]|nr:hypothetical protein [Burkholderiales bacterium]